MKRLAALILALAIFGVPTLTVAGNYSPTQQVGTGLGERDPNTIG